MSRYSLRRALAAAAMCASAVLLTACGSSSTESALNPTRLIAFGDAFADVGQRGGAKYTVNIPDDTPDVWLEQVASRYGQSLKPLSTGGLGYGQASARITAKPDAAGDATTLTVTEQIDAFLATHTPAEGDLVFVAGGIGDLITGGKAFLDGTLTQNDFVAQAEQAGRDLAAQTRRLVNAGSKHVVVVGPYDLALTPWGGLAGDKSGGLREASRRFNDVFKVAVVDMGNTVLYVDAAYYFTRLAEEPGDFNMDNSRDPVCTLVDAGPGIGIGAGQVNSALCTPSTVLAGKDYNKYMYADAIYAAPYAQRQFGDYAYDRIRNRW